MSRPGRHRKTGDRYKSGGLKPVKDDARRLAMWNRIKHQGERFSQDPKWQTSWGELFFNGHITETQVEAADRWAAMLVRYDGLNGYRRSTSSQPLERTDRTREDEQDAAEVKVFIERFEAAHDALVACGKLVEWVVTNLCRGETVREAHYDAVKTGLTALAEFYGLDKVRNAGR